MVCLFCLRMHLTQHLNTNPDKPCCSAPVQSCQPKSVRCSSVSVPPRRLPCKGFEQLHSNAADLGKRMSDTISYDACLTFRRCFCACLNCLTIHVTCLGDDSCILLTQQSYFILSDILHCPPCWLYSACQPVMIDLQLGVCCRHNME